MGSSGVRAFVLLAFCCLLPGLAESTVRHYKFNVSFSFNFLSKNVSCICFFIKQMLKGKEKKNKGFPIIGFFWCPVASFPFL